MIFGQMALSLHVRTIFLFLPECHCTLYRNNGKVSDVFFSHKGFTPSFWEIRWRVMAFDRLWAELTQGWAVSPVCPFSQVLRLEVHGDELSTAIITSNPRL